MMLHVLLLAALIAAPDGGEWQDPSRLSLGKEPVSTLRAPPDAIDLSGVEAWSFNWARRPSERPVGFEKPQYDVSSWPKVTVPCSWQASGIRRSGERFGVPIYVNTPYTFTPGRPANSNCPPYVIGNDIPKDWTFSNQDNPVGSYRRDFDIPAEWLEDEVFVRFEGVESFYYLWINGSYVGFSKDSRSPSVYNVTKYLKGGRNTVAVEVYRYCDGSYLECQDMFRLSGIIRPVRVYRLKKDHLKDVRFETHPEKKGVYEGDWILSFAADRPAEFKVYEKSGAEVKLEKVSDEKWRVRRPKLWSAEIPNLYTLVTEGISFNLGFREIEITEPENPRDRTFLINGQPVKLKGVNRSEVDPVYGHHCPTWRLRQDIELIKKGNFNHIRNSHCPQPDEFYDLCDEIGIYVMDEANLESHGIGYSLTSLSFRPEWLQAHLERQIAMVKRNRNHPSIVMWSMGNEAGPGDNFKVCYDWIKANDPTRPVNYERNSFFADVGSRQYPNLSWVKETAAGRENVKYPFHINEFLHNLNNNAGGVKSFQDAIESSNRILGGALWDFADQGLLAFDKKTGRKFYAFGGDFGEKPTDGQGILDGIVHADRTVEPAYHETRHAYQPYDARLSKDARHIIIESKYYFRDSSAYEFRVNGKTVGIKPIEPREKRRIALETLKAFKDRAGFLRLEFVQKEREGVFERGWVIASDQIALPDRSNSEHATCVKYLPPEKKAQMTESDGEITFSAGEYVYRFSKKTGLLVSISRRGEELLEEPVFLDVFRGPVGGDMSLGRDSASPIRRFGRAGLRRMRPVLKKLTGVTREGAALRFATIIDWRGERKEEIIGSGHAEVRIADAGETDPDAPGYHTATEWRIFGDGTIALGAAFRQFGAPLEVPRIGYRFVFKTPKTKVSYKARGPWDNYADRRSSAFVGEYACDSTDFLEMYGRSCDCGNRMDACAVRLESTGLTFAGLYAPIPAVQVLPYSPTELLMNPHPELLPPPRKTELGLYAVQSGLGSANCGPKPETRYRIDPAKTYSYSLLITPEKTLDKRTFYSPWDVNFDESKASGYRLENPLDYSRERILEIFAEEMYGREPPAPKEWMMLPGDEKVILGGRALAKTGKMRFMSETALWRFCDDVPDIRPVDWLLIKPRRVKGKVPVVLFLNYRGNHEYLSDLITSPTTGWVRNNLSLFIVDNKASELTRGKCTDPGEATYFPIAEIIERGYAVLTACYADLCADPTFEEDQEGLCFRGDRTIFQLWGERDESKGDNTTALGAWAWLLSRGLDYAASDPDLDITRSIVTGCSRLGKAALLAGARDERFTVVAPVQTGGGGCPLLKRNYGENAKLMNFAFRHWYCGNFRKYSGNEKAMPFDQHLLLAAVAPRKLLVSGFDAPMYDTKGEELAVEAARPVWERAGRGDALGYRRRGGRHGIDMSDWLAILDFAGRSTSEK
ncbi:MAG: hypothetical protein IKC80_08040 [Kiritimatiellae bacterium]|nr:hypothetical protein [Kiritimatiellia bacterium]